MKNQAIYQTNLVAESINLVAEKVQNVTFSQLLLIVGRWILATRPLMALGHAFSYVLGEEVSPLKALNLLHAFVAFFAMLLLGGNSILVQLGLVVWAGIAAYICKKDGWSRDED